MLIMASTENKDPTFSLKLYTSHGERPYDLTNLNQKSTQKKRNKYYGKQGINLWHMLHHHHMPLYHPNLYQALTKYHTNF